MANENQTGKEMVITRVFNAPRELVFKAWTEAEHITKWWGPKGSKIKVSKLDLRPGGIFFYSMTGPPHNNTTMWGQVHLPRNCGAGKIGVW